MNNIKNKYFLLFLVIITLITYGVLEYFRLYTFSNLVVTLNGFFATVLIFLNLKDIKDKNRIRNIFIFMFCLLWFLSDFSWLLHQSGILSQDTARLVSDVISLMASVFILLTCISIIRMYIVHIDKKQLILDFTAIAIITYYMVVSTIKIYYPSSFMYFESVNTQIMSLIVDVLSFIALILIASTFRKKIFEKTMVLDLIALSIFAVIDLVYVYQELIDVNEVGIAVEFIYTMPVMIFAISSIIKAKNTDLENDVKEDIKVDYTQPLNYGNSVVITVIFMIVLVIYFYLFRNKQVSQNELLMIVIFMGIYLAMSLNYQGFMKNKLLLEYQLKLNDDLETRVSERTYELEAKNQELLSIINTDILTSLGSRKHLVDILYAYDTTSAVADVVLFVVDIIQFKNINNISGHKIGDYVLMEVAKRLENLFPEDKVFRSDSNEFVIVMEGRYIDNITLGLISKDITNALTNTLYIEEYRINLNIAIGCSKYPENTENAIDLLQNAEYAVKDVKSDFKTSKNYKIYDDEMAQKITRKMHIETLLQSIDYDQEFTMYAQPQFTVDGSKLVGMEALLRWRSPKLGFVSPGEFIPIAETSNIIVNIVYWTMQEAIEKIKWWNETYNVKCKMGVNISPKYLENYNFIKNVEHFIKDRHVKPYLIDLEITEMTVMQVGESVIDIFNKLHELGVNISIDDFGTGYSSLSYIKNFKIDKLKIAKELIDNITTDMNEYMIVKAIVMMAKGLNLKTIAEGVEYKEQQEKLEKIGCDEIQGYYYGRPVPFDEFEKMYLTPESGVNVEKDD